jgi:tripartite-type tricarboxylate transporter receptor subunit TctC
MEHLLRMASVAVAALLGATSLAAAQDYPSQPITMIVAFSPGGASDVLARLIVDDLAKAVGQPIIVENKPGAGGFVAWRHMSESAPDGYTILLAENALAINSALQPAREFDPTKAFDAIAEVATAPLSLMVNPAIEATNVAELIAYSKANPDALSYSSSGIGSVSHMTFEAFKASTGLEAGHIPYKGGGEAAAAVVDNKAQAMMAGIGTAKKLVDGGQAKVLILTGRKRSPILPDVPTLDEAGINSDVMLGFWWGLFAPAGVPAEVKTKLDAAIQQVLADEMVKERLVGLDYTPAYAPAADMASLLGKEIVNWSAFIREKGIKVE